ncbi:flagellar biosynthetic protein FliO [Bordetella bronchialis]|uniref:Flagellar protein n=1 Tax=Bordetella bronchialis TaxID=463025 RepID=A0A193FI01_9BORD|nr:flagellar biosynthetic protein FliO [Bordetella bronchialis]ANN66821.1 flagellar biosynthetic protein FliO [Bordetella bronchialis]ANN71897.1 flagellar biosynthetic protein FliO [Bordetella bronchialis]
MGDAATVRVIVGLVFVIAAILACGWLARRTGLAGRAAGGTMRIVDSLNLGPRQRIVLLELADAWVLVGVTAGQMNVLHTMPAGVAGAPAQAPGALVTSFLARRRAKAGETAATADGEPLQSALPRDVSFASKLSQALRRG